MPAPEESGRTATLPRTELNPLQHPLLRKHLELWAEVYFGNPPDRRDEAVLKLLHELERRDQGENNSRSRAESSFRPESEGQPMVCEACGFATRPNQRFCGRCGARLTTPLADALEQERQNESASAEAAAPASRVVPSAFPTLLGSSEPAQVEESAGTEEEDTWEGYEDSTPLWRSYRLYVGFAFAILVGVLGYLAWRGGQSTPGTANLPQQAPSTSANVEHGPAATTSDRSGQKSPDTRPNLPTSASNPGPDAPTQNPATARAAPEANGSQVPTAANAENAPADAASGNGAEELTNAKNLLAGPPGKRDSIQAADWLWKSVAKKNTGAMVTLAELYLRGDGVPKNCDQAQVLLDASAKKGSKEAAEMLRNLPAFGCQ